MNADSFRHLYSYHFSENRLLWELCAGQLTVEQFHQPLGYSHGSIRSQIVHLVSVDHTWFSGLQGEPIPTPLEPENFPDWDSLRQYWDQVEQEMQAYLANLSDELLLEKPLEEEDAGLAVWQVLLQVVNHGTDHRAQVLRMLNDLGVTTTSQDYIFYAYDHPI